MKLKKYFSVLFIAGFLLFSIGSFAQVASFTHNGTPGGSCVNNFLLTTLNSSTPAAGQAIGNYTFTWVVSQYTSCGGTLVSVSPPSTTSGAAAFNLSSSGCYSVTLNMFLNGNLVNSSTQNCIKCLFPVPVASFTASPTVACGGQLVTLANTTTGGTPPYSCLWVPGFGTAVLNNCTEMVNYPCSGTPYTPLLQVTDANGCTANILYPNLLSFGCTPSISGVTYNPLPGCLAPLNVNGWTANVFPANSSINWTFTSASGGTNPSPGSVSNQNPIPAPITFPQNGCYNITVTATDPVNNCPSSATFNNEICLLDLVFDNISISQTNVCSGMPIQVTANAHTVPLGLPGSLSVGIIATPFGVGAPGCPPVNLSSVPSGVPSTAVLCASVPCPNTYTFTVNSVSYTDPNTGQICTKNITGGASVQCTVHCIPVDTLVPPPVSVLCTSGNSFVACLNPAPPAGATVSWYAATGAATSATASPANSVTPAGNCYTLNMPLFGTGEIAVQTCVNVGGASCCNKDSVTFLQTPLSCTFKIDSGVAGACAPNCVKFKVQCPPGSQDSLYTWDFGDGTTATTDTTVITHCYTSNGCDTVTLTILTKQNCVQIITKPDFIRVADPIVPVVTVKDTLLCMTYGKACNQILPDSSLLAYNIPYTPVPGSPAPCPLPNCHWIALSTDTIPFQVPSVVHNYNCDSPNVCVTALGHYDVFKIICSAGGNKCCDTILEQSAFNVIGVKANFIDSVHCSSSGSLTSNKVTFKSMVAVYPANAQATTVRYKIHSLNTCLSSVIHDTTFTLPASLTPQPRFTYNFPNPGQYCVCIYASNSFGGCPPDSFCRVVNITAYTAVINTSPLVFTKCLPPAPDTIGSCWTFTASGSSPQPPAIIKWDKDANGSIDGNGINYTACWDDCGLYYVKLKISNQAGSCQDSSSFGPVSIDSLTPRIKLIPAASCALCLQIRDSSSTCLGNPVTVNVNWKGVVAPGSPPPSSYVVTKLPNGTIPTVVTNVCYQTYPNQPLDFTYSTTTGCNRVKQIFPGGTSGNQASFTVTDTLICEGTIISITNTSLGNAQTTCLVVDTMPCVQPTNITSWTACTSPVSFPPSGVTQYTFNNPGYYNVYLRVQSSNSACRSDTCVTIHVQNTVADLVGPDTVTCPYQCVQYTNNSVGAASSMCINVSGFTAPIGTPPAPIALGFQICYSPPFPPTFCLPLVSGDYTIIQDVVSNFGCSDADTINVHVGGPVALMRVLDTLICRGDSFRVELFSNADTAILFACNGLPLGFSKYKIDADTVWVKPNQNGCCQVATYFDDGEGCVLVKFDTVCVDKPFADFTIPANGVFCGSQNVTFVNTSTQGIKPLNYPAGVWNIYHNGQATPIATVNGVQDLTYNFTLPGTYDVEYIVHSTFGCTDTAKFTTVITINENPTAAFTQNADTICINNTVSFTDISTYPTTAGTITWFWDYPNNTNVTQNVTNPTHFYNIPGLYQTVLVVQLANGCTDTSAGQSLLVLGNVIADFSTSDDSLCGNTGTINFTSTSTPISGVNYCWNFGDGTNPYACMSNSTNPSHTFTLTSPSGFQCFTIKLLISNSFGCIDSVAKTVCIFSNPVAGILTVNNNGCSPYTAYITDNSSSLNTISNYLIDWGEPTPTSSAIPPSLASHTYVTPGTFNVVYTITTIHGCTSIVNHQFTAYPLPTAFAGNDTSVCGGDVIQIGKVAIAGESYNWYSPLGVSFLPNNGVSNPLVSPVADITYCIEVANQFGCKDSDCVDVKVIPLVLANACCDTIICLNTPVTFSASGAISYQWDGLTDTSFHSTDSIISFIPVTSGIYEVTVTGPCNTATATVEVTVVPPPTINLEPNITIVAGQPYGILSVSAAGNSVVWSPNYNITCTNCPNPTVFPDVSTTYVVTVTDPYNCTTSDSITISVLCDRTNAIYIPNAFTPNTADKNSYFYIQGTGVKEIVSWKIFNRWGDMVWMGEHVPINVKESGWNGVYKGVAVSSDVYMYQMVVECHNGNKFPINGNVTVIR